MALRSICRVLKRNNFLSLLRNSCSHLHSHSTSFGFKEVKEEEKSQLVGNVFTSIASSYDIMNDGMSGGLHRLWKERLVSKLNPFPGMKHLDVAGGTGDVAFRILDSINSVGRRAMRDIHDDNVLDETQIFVCDINSNMLNVGKKRAQERGFGNDKSLVWVEGDAEALKFEDNSMDGYTIAFGIRNVTHIEKALAEAHRLSSVSMLHECQSDSYDSYTRLKKLLIVLLNNTQNPINQLLLLIRAQPFHVNNANSNRPIFQNIPQQALPEPISSREPLDRRPAQLLLVIILSVTAAEDVGALLPHVMARRPETRTATRDSGQIMDRCGRSANFQLVKSLSLGVWVFHRVLKQGGRFLCLELSHVELPTFKDFDKVEYEDLAGGLLPSILG
ncbi:2-methoxy-6-polyprenyl-1 4-benzoquinol methylase mitochondrial [Phtheirospermum japonicum]|uniref:2-methoxy-6-polyprenyl-1 4-benzoquinol methylase mitochondrial n=1 Tax=Phtheirospermum japonicum TaxID=374723 RepID=A0A830D5J7_9LAMI|nr:2-methoxy-6-polyprenyl-1 4-benzoquinol methylase mitochondrial [Phtheirospermum japonicum]